MRKLIPLIFAVQILLSCSNNISYRTVCVQIPQHPWEENTSKSLWYTVKWTNGKELESLHVDENTRTLSLKIPLGQTVYICAYPLGEMSPFACAVTPLSKKNDYLLNQNDGYLIQEIINLEEQVRSRINYPHLSKICFSKTEDFRTINKVDLLQDILNGKLNKSSVKIKSPVEVPPVSTLDGIWISENLSDNLVTVENRRTPQLFLNPGINRFYCPKENREMRITVDYDSSVHAVMRQASL